jgi:hypothetical protein
MTTIATSPASAFALRPFGRDLLGPRAAPRRFAGRDRPSVGRVDVAVAGCATSSAIYATVAEVQECARPTQQGIFTLDQDIRSQFVYRDPTPLQARYDELIANEKKYGDTFPKNDAYLQNKAALKAELDALNAKGGTLTDAKMKKQIAFSNAWFGFKQRWDDFYTTRVLDPAANAGKTEAEQTSAYDDEYRQFVEAFKALGGKPTFVPNKPGGEPVDWQKYAVWALVVLGIGVTGYLLSQIVALAAPHSAIGKAVL